MTIYVMVQTAAAAKRLVVPYCQRNDADPIPTALDVKLRSGGTVSALRMDTQHIPLPSERDYGERAIHTAVCMARSP